MAAADVLMPTSIPITVHSHTITHNHSGTHVIQVQTPQQHGKHDTQSHHINGNGNHINAITPVQPTTNTNVVHIKLPRPIPAAGAQPSAPTRPPLHIQTNSMQQQQQQLPQRPPSNIQLLQQPSAVATPPQHMHVKVTPPGQLDVSDDSDGAYDSSEDYEDDVSSEDNSPRENRVLTFADEHGVNLCDFCYYEPEPAEHDDSVYEHYQQPTRELQPTGCFACFMPTRPSQPIRT